MITVHNYGVCDCTVTKEINDKVREAFGSTTLERIKSWITNTWQLILSFCTNPSEEQQQSNPLTQNVTREASDLHTLRYFTRVF